MAVNDDMNEPKTWPSNVLYYKKILSEYATHCLFKASKGVYVV